ncbi:MAG: endonuclease/exonuclease/phosphatase family protein [Myxococcales bacterium]|jgi:endonuclease/exonuclease/phosphatase family metal-dependent hydrolase
MARLRLLTANLWNGGGEPGALAAVVERHGVDAVLTQEMSPAQSDALAAHLPHGLRIPGLRCNGMGLSLRRPARVRRVALPLRDALVARLEPAQWPQLPAALEIINVHIAAPTRRGRLAVRRGQVAGLRRHLQAERLPRVLAGDLNSLWIMPAYRALRAHLDDAALLHAGARRRPPLPTWSPRADWPRLLRIDHVLTSGLRVRALRPVRIAGSDHSAVLAELEL